MSEEHEVQMFGETLVEMKRMKPSYMSNQMYAMSILSDVQELLARDDFQKSEVGPEWARQWINKAKYFISESMKGDT